MVRTSLPAGALGAGAAVESYKALENVERVFRGLSSDLLIRPIRHRLEDRVRAHVLIRMLAYYVTWHMQQRLAPILFKDDDPAVGKAPRPSPVAPAQRSPAALAKAATKATPGGGARAQFRHPARRPGHDRRQPHQARRRPARLHCHHHAHPVQRQAWSPAHGRPVINEWSSSGQRRRRRPHCARAGETESRWSGGSYGACRTTSGAWAACARLPQLAFTPYCVVIRPIEFM